MCDYGDWRPLATEEPCPPFACPLCNGSGMGVDFANEAGWYECIVCCGFGTVAFPLARVVAAVLRGEMNHHEGG